MRKIAIVLMSVICAGLPAQEATRWRGPAGDGIYPETGLLDEWPADGPEMLWHFEGLGEGYSSPSFANGKIYINGMSGGKGYVYILNQDGELLEKAGYGDEFTTSYPGARSSVTVAGDLMYVMSGTGSLVCMDAVTGQVKWDRSMFRDFDGKNITWGITETVVVDGDRVYCTPGGSRFNVVALDRYTGNLIWAAKGKGNLSAYCTPMVAELPGRKVIITHTASNIICLDASNGEMLWSQGHTNTYAVHPNTPIVHDGGVYCFSGYGQGGVLVEMDDKGMKTGVRWTDKTLDSRMGGAVMIGGYIYGSGDMDRSWKSLDWKTGEQGYSSTSVGNGVVIAADGKLYMYSQRGELAMAPVKPEALQVKGQMRVSLGTGPHWAHPVINGGRLFVRHGDVLMAFKIK